jgi:hypothetical protein
MIETWKTEKLEEYSVNIDNLVVINGENKKEHEYLIPKTKVHHYGDNQVYFNISQNNLKEFEI